MAPMTKREKIGAYIFGALLCIALGVVIYDPALRRCEALGGTNVINGRCMIVTESRLLVPWHPAREQEQ